MSKSIPEPNNLPENPKLSVCMIVRDEEKTLPRCLKSVEPVANELIVVDTGSKDNTVLVANDLGAKVFHFEWCDDFATARNESIKHATSDWVLQIDADEELVGDSIPHLRQCIRKPNVICQTLFDFIKEPWDPVVLNYHNKQHNLFGESSAEQVTKPLYTTAVKRWVNDLPPFDKETVKEVAGDLLVELGYAEDLDW